MNEAPCTPLAPLEVSTATAKMVNYALLYGKTSFTLAKDIGVTPQEAQAFIDQYFADMRQQLTDVGAVRADQS